METAIFIALVVWFLIYMPDAIQQARWLEEQQQRDLKTAKAEDAYFDNLKGQADAGDKQAIATLGWFGYDTVAHGWETRDGRAERLKQTQRKASTIAG